MRRLITTLAVAALAIGFAGVSEAKAPQCKDASGKFIKCPEAAAPPVVRCRDKTTKKFAKCSASNTEPVPMTAASPAPAPSASPKPTPVAAPSPKPMPSMAASPKPATTTGPGKPGPSPSAKPTPAPKP